MFLIIKGRFFEKLTKIIFEIVHSKIFGYTVVLWHQIWDTLYSSKKFMYHFKNVNNSRTVQNKYDIGIEIRKKELFRDVIIYRVCRVSFTLETANNWNFDNIILYYNMTLHLFYSKYIPISRQQNLSTLHHKFNLSLMSQIPDYEPWKTVQFRATWESSYPFRQGNNVFFHPVI